MKKFLLLLTLIFTLSWADSCPLFSVDYIEDNGTFRQIECFESFQDAEQKRAELGENYVVRSIKSLSPSRIISMGKGLAYSYAGRSGSSTQNIYERINEEHNGTGASTYLSSHYEMSYHGTSFYTEYFGYSGGYVNVTMNGFTGYADLEYVDLVPMKFIEKGIPITLGGNDKLSYEEPFNVRCEQNYYEAKKNGNYTDLVFTFHRAWSSNGGKALTNSISIGIAPSFMKEGVKYYSDNGIDFYTDPYLTEIAGIYYNYYQFLPVRTYTNISSDIINGFLKDKGKSDSIIQGKGFDFIDSQNKYGVNGATILCMAIHESAWGTSTIAKNKNNLFGWGAFDDATSNASSYETVADCIAAQMGDNLANYLDVSSGLYYSMSLGNKGGGFITKYASDPYWAEKISQYYYELDKYSKNYDGSLTDFNSVSLALVKNITNVYDNENNSVFTTENKKNGYQNNLIVPVIEVCEKNSKINIPNPKNDNEIIYPIKLPIGTLVEYDRNNSIGYIKNEDLVPLNYTYQQPEEPETPPVGADFDTLSYVENISVEEELSIKGNAILTLHDYSSPGKTKYTLLLKNQETDAIDYSFELNTVKEEGLDLNDGYNYSYCGFEGSIDLTLISQGKYLLILRIENIDSREIILRSFNVGTKAHNNEFSYIVKQNTIYGNRLELDVLSTPVDYSLINKPENRESMFAFDDIFFDDEAKLLKIDGVAMIYYLDYDNQADLSYTVYLIKSKDDYVSVPATVKTCDIDYSGILESSYDMSNICFTSEIDVSKLKGEYSMIMEIKNRENMDYINMSTNSDLDIVSDNQKYKIKKGINSETIFIAED